MYDSREYGDKTKLLRIYEERVERQALRYAYNFIPITEINDEEILAAINFSTAGMTDWDQLTMRAIILRRFDTTYTDALRRETRRLNREHMVSKTVVS